MAYQTPTPAPTTRAKILARRPTQDISLKTPTRAVEVLLSKYLRGLCFMLKLVRGRAYDRAVPIDARSSQVDCQKQVTRSYAHAVLWQGGA